MIFNSVKYSIKGEILFFASDIKLDSVIKEVNRSFQIHCLFTYGILIPWVHMEFNFKKFKAIYI